MKPVNNKSLLSHLFAQMEKLDEGHISVEEANAQANLTKEANKLLKYELDRAKTEIQLDKHNKELGKNRQIRNAESLGFE